MSLLGVTFGNVLGSLAHQVAQFVRGQNLGIRSKTEQGAYQPVILRRRAAKTQQSSLCTFRLNRVAQVGITLHDQDASRRKPDAYFLVRAYDSLEHRRSSQEAFYSSAAWRNGPRQSIIELIEADWDVVLWLAPVAIDAMRISRARAEA